MSRYVRSIALIACIAAMVGASASAQVVRQTPVDPPIVLSGSEIGFRIVARRGTTPVGSIVVRVNGQWVEADFAGEAIRKATN